MTLDFEADDRPPYLQAAELLREEITSGRLKPGDKLPSSRTLQERYGIASSTVQNTLRLLKSEGLIYSVQGRGSFVRNSATAAPADGREEIAETADLTPGPSAESLAEEVAELKTAIKRIEETLSRLAAHVQEQRER
ncbi:GntR family transcriptional regulator [Streptomyces sp. ISL-100]|uniref:GntR family transcriptional regulator n=1 Tax=Streptomyces sp. ISL-100 TaxID=2819173 RepID=UPI001BED252B|nr:GntR family transcriptional regulator [Streptomyces sp. ISL-100]MBT2398665.1 GntR family transcriptional regulator [Streptomyces sp. ISL-100]